MSDKKNQNLTEAPGLLSHAFDHIKDKAAKAKDARARAYASSPEGAAAQNKYALDQWVKKISGDWHGYAARNHLEPTEANLASFIEHTYPFFHMGNYKPSRTAPVAPAQPAQAAPTAAAPQQAPVAPAQPAPSPAPATANAPAPAPTQAPQPVSPAPVPTPAPAPSAPSTNLKSASHYEKMLQDPTLSKDERKQARRDYIAAKNLGESIGIGEDVLSKGNIHIDDLATTIDKKSYKDKSLLDTISDLGLYDHPRKTIEPKKGATLKEEPTAQAAAEPIDLSEQPLSPTDLTKYFTDVARHILNSDHARLEASKEFPIGSPEYVSKVRFLQKQTGTGQSYAAPRAVAANSNSTTSYTASQKAAILDQLKSFGIPAKAGRLSTPDEIADFLTKPETARAVATAFLSNLNGVKTSK